MAIGPTIFNGNILTIDESAVPQAFAKGRYQMRIAIRGLPIQEPDHWDRLLLRASSERPQHRGADSTEKFTPLHVAPTLRRGLEDYITLEGTGIGLRQRLTEQLANISYGS
jgi:hypothetical protein